MRFPLYPFLITLCLGARLFAQDIDSSVYDTVEMPALFGNCGSRDLVSARTCSDQAVIQYIGQQIKYPEVAREQNIQGVVVVQFIVQKDGTTAQHKIVRDIGGGCGEEALRVLAGMQGWKPGMVAGKNVHTRMVMPIRFRLDDDVKSAQVFTLYLGTATSEDITKEQLTQAFSQPVYVRDEAGNSLKIYNLTLTVESKRKTKTITCAGNQPSKSLVKLVKSANRNSVVVLGAQATHQGKPTQVQRTWVIK